MKSTVRTINELDDSDGLYRVLADHVRKAEYDESIADLCDQFVRAGDQISISGDYTVAFIADFYFVWHTLDVGVIKKQIDAWLKGRPQKVWVVTLADDFVTTFGIIVSPYKPQLEIQGLSVNICEAQTRSVFGRDCVGAEAFHCFHEVFDISNNRLE